MLSKVQISYAYPFLSLAYVVVAVYAYFVFQEDLSSPARIAGIGLHRAGHHLHRAELTDQKWPQAWIAIVVSFLRLGALFAPAQPGS